MRFAYPAVFEPETGGGYFVSFPDVPEALTGGDDRAAAKCAAADALAAALAGYVHDRRDIPAPGRASKGQELVAVPPVVAAKLALYRAMRAQKVNNTDLARRLELSEGAVRKLLNPDHRSHIGQVETALRALGQDLVVESRAA